MEKGKRLILGIVCVALSAFANVRADMSVTVDPGASWIGYLNVFDIPQNASMGPYPPDVGPYIFGSAWGTADLVATFSGPVLTLKPNSVNDPSTFWYIGGGAPGAIGNKITAADMYVEVGSLPNQTLTFSGTVLESTLLGSTDPLGNGWTAVAFVKDFAPDYSSYNEQSVALTDGAFSVSLATVDDPTRHVQYGFEVEGPDVWITENSSYGDIQVGPIPEPSSIALVLSGLLGLGALGWKKRRS
ncbi:MAG TPA: PEP-CTERM sorting domain-containing protein [Verrucomicrobiae bacterium]|nr:PEP-CTERM sorting domain-containing protein [Verrucomicrobiae bacterium]